MPAKEEQQMTQTEVAGSNSLPELAARIRAEHEATGAALKSSIGHSIAAGELLIEAKDKVPHGQWLPWLRDNCAISERTAQLYMRLAKNRTEIEASAKSATLADLTLNEAAALLMLSSDIRKVLDFARDCENLPADEVIERCITDGIAVIQSPGYDPMAGRSEAEQLEWHLFMLFLSDDGGNPEAASHHVEWLLQRPFRNVAEWLGDDKWRRCWGMRAMPEKFKADWSTFLDQHREWIQPDVIKKLESLQSEFEQARASQATKRRGSKRARR
jgi:hypothetical protein